MAKTTQKKPPEPAVRVVKSHALNRASHRLTTLEYRLVIFAIAWAREKQLAISADAPLTIDVAKFAKTYGVPQQNAYNELRDATRKLLHRQVYFEQIDETTGELEKVETLWISRLSYIDNMGQIKIIFAPDIVSHITRQSGGFLSYELNEVVSLKHLHSFRMYELLRETLNTKTNTGWLACTVDELRFYLGILPTEYPVQADLARYVIKPAIADITANTSLEVVFKQIREGRAVTRYRFDLRKAPQSVLLDAARLARIEEEKENKIKRDTMLANAFAAFVTTNALNGESQKDAEKRLRPKFKSTRAKLIRNFKNPLPETSKPEAPSTIEIEQIKLAKAALEEAEKRAAEQEAENKRLQAELEAFRRQAKLAEEAELLGAVKTVPVADLQTDWVDEND